jgi:hypothetical protein
MNGKSLTLQKVKLKQLQELMPKVFIEGKVDFERLKATQEIVTSVLNEKPQKVIALDRFFKGNDQLKTNTALQMKDAGIECKAI